MQALCAPHVTGRLPPLPRSSAEVVVLIHAAGKPNFLGSSERVALKLLLVVNRVRTLDVILAGHAPTGEDLLGDFTVDDAVDGAVVQRSRGHAPMLPSRIKIGPVHGRLGKTTRPAHLAVQPPMNAGEAPCAQPWANTEQLERVRPRWEPRQ
ncbi:hypothetical protein STPH1_3411 [Streptomyces sp. OM5714]|nr:hypothetical protein STPH1_3411 [Streptomyces sp. OM5714]